MASPQSTASEPVTASVSEPTPIPWYTNKDVQLALRTEIAAVVQRLMIEKNISPSDVATISGRSLRAVEGLRKGESNAELETIADVTLALGFAAHVSLSRILSPEGIIR